MLSWLNYNICVNEVCNKSLFAPKHLEIRNVAQYYCFYKIYTIAWTLLLKMRSYFGLICEYSGKYVNVSSLHTYSTLRRWAAEWKREPHFYLLMFFVWLACQTVNKCAILFHLSSTNTHIRKLGSGGMQTELIVVVPPFMFEVIYICIQS